MAETPGDRRRGHVARVLRDYGFISCADFPGQDIYFKKSWFKGSPPLLQGEEVTFLSRTYEADSAAPGGAVQRTAYDIQRVDDSRPKVSARRPGDAPTEYVILGWADLGHLPNVLRELRGLALKETWEFRNTPQDPERPTPILYSYLLHTFGRLVLERKVLVNESRTFAAFNTGLVDPRYEPIHALFVPNDDPRLRWQLTGFCIPGEGADGQNLVRHFSPLPAPAHYFDNPLDLLYDARVGKPELDWKHIIIDNIDRYPDEFIGDHLPSGFVPQDATAMSDPERQSYYKSLGSAIEVDTRTYRRIMNRVKDAVDLSIKRVSWNFKTAVPQYYPRVKRLQLLLPVCLVSDDLVDLALAVEKTPAGSYLGHTVLALDWAYRNARLICRPDSDWLEPSQISGAAGDEA